jgi:hypothetical protein
VQSLRVDQELILAAWHGQTEVIADAFVESKARRQPQRRRQINARLNDCIVVSHKPLSKCMVKSDAQFASSSQVR